MSAVKTLPSAMAPAPIGPGRFVLVVGPSGAGKDTLIAGAKATCSGDPAIVFPRRVVTRPASDAEDHDCLNDAAFDGSVNNGAFAFWWQAHGLKYGVPRTVDDDIRAGRTVVCNVSRGIVDEMRARYARVDAVLIVAPPGILAERLAGRSRETDGCLAQRIQRNDAFADFRAAYVIENIGVPTLAVRKLIDVIHGKIAPRRS
jgi:ribose 1,5-bisphosphokinase